MAPPSRILTGWPASATSAGRRRATAGGTGTALHHIESTADRVAGGVAATSDGGGAWRALALAAALGTFALIVLGGIVRITGSGMGCGDDWPLCNGRLLPPLDLPTLIEYGHRLAAAAVGALVLVLAALAWRPGRGPEWRRPRMYALAAVTLLLVQVMLGAITVWLGLPPASVVLHLGTAMLLVAVLIVVACDAWVGWVVPAPDAGRSEPRGSPSAEATVGRRSRGWWAAALGLAVVLAGALVANLEAAPACQGFPLCNGEAWPAESWRAQLHWGHRVGAYALAGWALALPFLPRRSGAVSRRVRAAAGLAAAAAAAQIAVGAVMVLAQLPAGLRALHVALGTAVFAALVAHARLAAPRAPIAAGGRVAGPERAPAEAAAAEAAGALGPAG